MIERFISTSESGGAVGRGPPYVVKMHLGHTVVIHRTGILEDLSPYATVAEALVRSPLKGEAQCALST